MSLEVSSKKGNEVQVRIDILLSDQVVFKQKSENKENTKGFKCEMWPRFLVWYKHGYFNCVIMNGMKKIKTSVVGQ